MRTPRPFPDRLFVDLVPVTTFCSTRHLNAQDSPKSVLKGHCAVQNPGIRGGLNAKRVGDRSHVLDHREWAANGNTAKPELHDGAVHHREVLNA